jgi:hypothetical protein
VIKKAFRPLPPAILGLRLRARHNEYARFYGNYVSMTGKKKRFSFQVTVNPRLKNKQKYRLIVKTVGALLNNTIPEHVQGEVFDSFQELHYKTRWLRVRRLNEYKAGMHYER